MKRLEKPDIASFIDSILTINTSVTGQGAIVSERREVLAISNASNSNGGTLILRIKLTSVVA